MKKFITLFLAAIVFCIPAYAVDQTPDKYDEVSLAKFEAIAYQDLNEADPEMKKQILEARETIIFSRGWVANGATGRVLDANGNVIKELPQFEDIFPSDWEVPKMLGQDTQKSDNLPENFYKSPTWGDALYFSGEVFLELPPDNYNSKPFCTVNTETSLGTQPAYVKTLSTSGVYMNPGRDASYNIGYANASTGESLGWEPNLNNGEVYSIDPPKKTKVSVRASTNYLHVGGTREPWLFDVRGVIYATEELFF